MAPYTTTIQYAPNATSSAEQAEQRKDNRKICDIAARIEKMQNQFIIG